MTTTKHVITRLYRGDTEVARWDPDAAAEIKTAEEMFNGLRLGTKGGGRHLMSTLADPAKPHGDMVELKEFDPNAAEIFAIPQPVGG
jgi:hypothetical protein